MSFFTRAVGIKHRLVSQTTLPRNGKNHLLYPRIICPCKSPYSPAFSQKTRGYFNIQTRKLHPRTMQLTHTTSYSTIHNPINEGNSTMYKVKRFGLGLLFGTLLGIGTYAYANNASSDSFDQIQPVTSSKLEGLDWVRLCVDQYPEILWLADENVRITEEGTATLQGSYSEQLFGKKCIEFDRTIMTLYCLKLILYSSDKAYQKFTAAQPEDTKLSKESFDKLHRQGLSLLRSRFQGMTELEMIQAMEASLVLGDIGKSEKAREAFESYGANAPDHDDFHGEVIQILQKHPELCPTFNLLTPAAKKLISRTANLAHYGHITHLEGGSSMFSKLKKSDAIRASSIFLLFDLLVHTCDVAGALGHINNKSSLVYTEPSHLAMKGVFESCNMLTDPNKTEMDAYNAYLAIRADWLGLNVQDRIDRVLTRVGAMLRLFTPEDGIILKQAVLKLPSEIRSQIIEQLDIQEGEELERTPTYIPAVLVNLANNSQLGSSKSERLSQAVILGLPFIAHTLKTHKHHLTLLKADPSVPLCFNKAAGVAKIDPSVLKGKYEIDPEGNVLISGF